MPENPKIDSKEFFAMLDEMELVRKESAQGYPWSDVMEDRYAAELCVGSLYAAHKIPAPRAYSWARSPRAMWGAIKLMRQFQKESRQNVVAGLIPMTDPVETEAKRVMLDTVLDRTLSVTMGGNLAKTFAMGHSQMRRSLVDLKRVLESQMAGIRGLGAGQREPTFAEMTLWPVEKLPHQFFHLQRQAIIIAPFTHVCFFSRPPAYIYTDDHGHLHRVDGPAVRFEDGFEIWAQQTDEESTALPDSPALQLPAPEKE